MTGNTDIEDGLERLDELMLEEALMASTEVLKLMGGTNDKIRRALVDVDGGVKGVEGKIQDVCGDVHDARNKIQSVEGRVQVRGEVLDVGDNISQGVKDQLNRINRSLLP